MINDLTIVGGIDTWTLDDVPYLYAVLIDYNEAIIDDAHVQKWEV